MARPRPQPAGDFFYIPANTVHAIGGDLAIIEVQQNSDITYRLFDYGRPRELHLEQGMAVARGEPHPPALRRHVGQHGTVRLVDGPCFRLDRVTGPVPPALAAGHKGALLVIGQKGVVSVGGEQVAAGQCALAASVAMVSVADGAQALLASPLQAIVSG